MFKHLKEYFNNSMRKFNFGGYAGQAAGWNDPYGYNFRPLGGSNFDYRREVGAPWENSIISACIQWAERAFPEARLMVQRYNNGTWEEEPDHYALRLLKFPNKEYSSNALWTSIVRSWMLDGNVYLYADFSRSVLGWPNQLFYIPHTSINPRFDENGSTFINDYIYRTGRDNFIIPKDNIVQFRNGLSLDNTRKGTCPILGVLREICADNEASTAAAAIMRNLGVPGITFVPADSSSEMTQEQLQKLREMGREKFTGDRRGEMLVTNIPGKFEQFGFAPEQLAFDKIRKLPEERICAAFGLPAMVIGMGAGLERSTFTNYKEAREAAYENCMIPMYKTLADQLSWELLPIFDESPKDVRFWFDTSEITALQEDQNARYERIGKTWERGLIKRNEARTELGYQDPNDTEGDIFYNDLPRITERISDIDDKGEKDIEKEPK